MKWGGKERVNWTITKEAFNVLKAAKKANPRRSISDLASHAILKTFKDPLDEATEKAKYHYTEFLRWKDIKDTEEEKRRTT